MTDHMLGDQLRAHSWDEFMGQSALKERLATHIQAASTQDRMLDHVLLAGPPGFGKTSLAQIITQETGDAFAAVTMPMKPLALAAMLRQFGGGVLLLDEIHRAPHSQQEDLLSLLEAGQLRLPNGRYIEVEFLTIIGATTEPEKVIPPLYDRFPIKPVFEPYSDEDMGKIVASMARKVSLNLDPEFSVALGRATGGIPRNARQLVLGARDVLANGRSLTLEAVLQLCGVEADGLTDQHLRYLRTLSDLQGQAGLAILASMLRLHPSTLQGLERLLLERQLLTYGSNGRELTSAGFARVQTTVPRMRRIS